MSLVSVIITTYNRPDFLKETLQSVVKQTYTSIEIIVIDDGSKTDDARVICKEVPNCTYFKKSNGGVASARNFGITKAKGSYLAFLDDDDVWLPNKIAVQVSLLEKNNDFGLVHSMCSIIDENSKATGEVIGLHKDKKLKHGDVKMRMLSRWTLMMPTVLLRKSLQEQVGLFNENMPQAGEDVEYWTRCSFVTKFYFLEEPLALYRKHMSNISADKTNYVLLPLYLYAVLRDANNKALVTDSEYRLLKQEVLFSQAGYGKSNCFKTVKHLFKIEMFWFVKIPVLKQFLGSILYT